MTTFDARTAELEAIRQRLFSDPPSTVRAARAILKRTNRVYDEQIAELRKFNAVVHVFNRELRKLARRAAS